MKFMIFTLFVFFTANQVQAKVVELDQKNINVGWMTQAHEQLGSMELTVVRTDKTPKKVNLEIGLYMFELFCRFPGYPIDGNGNFTNCYAYDWYWAPQSEVIRLNFKKAKRLSAGEAEVFQLKIKQLSTKSLKLNFEVDTFDSTRNYEIYFNPKYDPRWFFGRPRLKFVAGE